MSEVTTEADIIREEANKPQREIDQLKQQNEKLKHQLEVEQFKRVKAGELALALQKEIEQLKEENIKLQRSIKFWRNIASNKNKTNTNLKRQIEQLKEENERLKVFVKTLQNVGEENLNNLQQYNNQLKDIIRVLVRDISWLEQKINNGCVLDKQELSYIEKTVAKAKEMIGGLV